MSPSLAPAPGGISCVCSQVTGMMKGWGEIGSFWLSLLGFLYMSILVNKCLHPEKSSVWPQSFSSVTLSHFLKVNELKRKSSWPQEFEGDAEVVAEVEKVLHVHHIVGVVLVFPSERVQDLQLHQGLVVKSEVIGEGQGGWEMETGDMVSYHAAAVAHFLSSFPWPWQGRKH